MTNIFKKSFLFLAACFLANAAWGATIYSTDLVQNPTGATTEINKGEFTTAPAWASGYTQCFHTTGSAGAVTLTFTTPISLSGYSNCKLILYWGAESNRPLNLTINGGSSSQIDAVKNSAERSTVRTASADLSVTSISSIKINGSGGGNSYYFRIEITGDGEGQGGGGDDPTPGGGDDPTPGGGDDPTPGGGDDPTPGTGGTVIFDWSKSGSNGFTEDMTDLNVTGQGTMTVGTSVYGRKLGENNVDHNNKGYKLATNDVCIEIQGTSDFIAGDLVTIYGVCGGSGARAFAIAPETSTSASTDTELTNTQESTSETLEYKVTVTSVQAGSKIRVFRMAGKTMYISAIKVTRTGDTPVGPVISTDATLSALTYDGISVPDFSATKFAYEVELPAGTTTVPTVAATKNDPKASDPVIIQDSSLPGNATVTVTAEDGTTTKTYTISFTVASAAPKVLTATWTNIKGTANIDQVNKTITGEVTNGSSLSLTPSFTGNNIDSWSPTEEQNFANGAVNYTFTSSTNETTVYAVTITEAPVVSTDATLSSLRYGSQDVPDFSPDTYTYNIELTYGIKTPPAISATPNNRSATVDITQAPSVPGTGKVVVTAQDGVTKLTYTINYTTTAPTPSTGLSLHEPEVYEAPEMAGGYGGNLTVDGGREFEVYYMTRDSESKFCIATTSADKTKGITTRTSGDYACQANDGWFKFSGTGWSSSSDAMGAEFGAMARRLDMDNSCEFTMYISGFDQFALVARDKKQDTSSDHSKPDNNRYLEVYIDDVLQPQQFNTNPSIRRYNISSAAHLVRVVHHGSEKSAMYAFSLRLAQEPRTKWLKGNDSTQVVKQTLAITPVTYTTKYNNIPNAETRLTWDGQEATGINLFITTGTLSDTLVLRGKANCPVGEYKYHVIAYYNGKETNRISGKFKVVSSIEAKNSVNVHAYTDEDMDQIIFAYYALSADEVQLTWPNGKPDGIRGSGYNGKYVIGGVPTSTGTFPYAITVNGADTTIEGKIIIEQLTYTEKSVLYIYKNDMAFDKDGTYKYLKGTGNNKWDLIARKQKEDGTMRSAAQYQKYKWILISEDADADNPEVLGIIRGDAKLPVLNLKGFTYSEDRLAWGEPDNGAIDTTKTKKVKGTKLYIQQPAHPVFGLISSLNKGDSIQILSNYDLNGIMPINVDLPGTFCLATGYTRNINDYYQNGEMQTALHEVPAYMRNGNKYICLPIAGGVEFTAVGYKLMDGIISYLLSSEGPGIKLPILRINSFELLGQKATIDELESTITLSLSTEDFDKLAEAKPTIVLEDPDNSHITPSIEPSIDLRNAVYFPKLLTVTDYINRRGYKLTIEIYDPQGIENAYEAGQWVNIFDIYGRKVATTNEDIYSMDLPRGMYIVVMENGETLKIMR